MMRQYKVYERKTDRFLASFPSRKEAVWYCGVNQTLPIPDYEWEDEFYITEQVPTDAQSSLKG